MINTSPEAVNSDWRLITRLAYRLNEKEAHIIRRQLLEKFSGKNRLQEMTFAEKKDLLHWLFDG